MDAQTLALFAGVVLSLLFSYIPGLNTWFAALDSSVKRLWMLALLLLVGLSVVGIACAGFGASLGISVTCDQAGFIGVLKAFVAAMIANQAAYAVTPQTAKVLAAKS
jgi:hypothetical protein